MSKKIIATLCLVIALFLAATAATLAWYTSGSHKEEPQLTGSLLGGFFESGNGSKASPYIITRPIHVYNLAWLQYLGEFNKPNADGKIMQTYFKIGDSVESGIDMEGLVIPPIGTKEYPFVGNFNGNNKSIFNFTVSNYVGGEEGIERRPSQVTSLDGVKITDDTNVSVVGFFGVIGKLSGSTLELVNNGLDEDGTTVINSVYNLVLDDFTVRTDTDESLVGLLAGYVNGTITNVGVGLGNIVIEENVVPLQVSTLNGVTEQDALKAVSMFSLVGACDKDVKWEDLPTDSLGTGSGDGGQGDSAGWGGSMNMVELAKRITYMYSENVRAKAEGETPIYAVSSYPTGRGDSGQFIYNSNSSFGYLNKDTIIPLNIQSSTMIDGVEEETFNVYFNTSEGFTTTKTDGYTEKEYKTNKWYAKKQPELIGDNNTGYIVGGGKTDQYSSSSVRIRVNPLGDGGIYKSISKTESESATISRENFSLLTVDKEGNTRKITDYTYDNETKSYVKVNKTDSSVSESSYTAIDSTVFKQYDTVISSFVKNIGEDTLISGLRFYPLNAGIAFKDNTITSKTTINAEIGKNEYTNYEVATSAVNFHLSDKGYITVIAGTYVSSTNDHSLFNLYKVERTEGKITSAIQITSIWVPLENDELNGVVYNPTSDMSSTHECVYDSTKMSTLIEENAAYYFEFPVTSGDYVLGLAEGVEKNGAYLLYLDIGANAAGTGSDGTGDGEGTDVEHAITGVNFIKENDSFADDGTPSWIDYPLIVARLSTEIEGAACGGSVAFERTEVLAFTYGVTDDARFDITFFYNKTYNNSPITITMSNTIMTVPKRKE